MGRHLGLFGRRRGGVVSRSLESGPCAAACSTFPSRPGIRTHLDPQFGQFQWVGEIERRYKLWDQPGKLAISGFLTRGRNGKLPGRHPARRADGRTPRTSPPCEQYQSRGGVSMNLEQQLMPNVGALCPCRDRGWQ